MVTHAVNNQWMCSNLNRVKAPDLAAAVAAAGAGLGVSPEVAAASMLAVLSPKILAAESVPDPDCRDLAVTQNQITEAFAMQADIDRRSGGPGRGWYRIVRTPKEARSVIAQGKLAVVLGVEIDNLFGCDYGSTHCSVDYVRGMVKNYYDQGVRHLFVVHFYDNAFAGSANQNFLVTSRLKNPSPKRQCGAEGYAYDEGLCNARGLTPLGRVLVNELMSIGMIFDVDHLSALSFKAVMSMVTPKKYPVVSSHSGFTEIGNGAQKHEGNRTPADISAILDVGGMFAIIPHQGTLEEITQPPARPGIAQTRIQHACGNSSETTAQAYLYATQVTGNGPVGLGTDFNGFAGWPGPRFGAKGCSGDKAINYRAGPMLAYPFNLRASGVDLIGDKAILGTRTYDFNVDGLSHMGLLPDMLADFQAMGMSRNDLDAAFSSAEGYIRLWERATYISGH